MKYDLTINQHNIKPHLDIENDIQGRKDGLFTFTLRIHERNIEDYAQYETITIETYAGIGTTIIEEQNAAHNTGVGSENYAIRPNPSQRGSKEWSG